MNNPEPTPSPAISGLTDDGIRVPPIPGDPPCDEYDQAGIGAGLEADGHPQCANCGHPKSSHAPAISAEAREAAETEQHQCGRSIREPKGFFVQRAIDSARAKDRATIERLTARFTLPIVCICGSTKFKQTWIAENARLTREGNIVLSVGLWGHHERVFPPPEVKKKLDATHKRKIDLCDWVWVVDVGGYIGESTRSEIEYAEKLGRPVRYLSLEFPSYVEPKDPLAETIARLESELAEAKANYASRVAGDSVITKSLLRERDSSLAEAKRTLHALGECAIERDSLRAQLDAERDSVEALAAKLKLTEAVLEGTQETCRTLKEELAAVTKEFSDFKTDTLKENEETSEAWEQLSCCFPAIQYDCDDQIQAAQFINAAYEQKAARAERLAEALEYELQDSNCDDRREGREGASGRTDRLKAALAEEKA